jgi:hypothetical protein
MGHWQRAKLKKQIQDGFLSALRASAADCLTRTTSQRNILSIAADTLAFYQQMRQTAQKSRLAKKGLSAKKKKERS